MQKTPEHRYRIIQYNGDHMCLTGKMPQDHEKLDSNLIASYIIPLASNKVNLAISQIKAIIKSTFEYTVIQESLACTT